jgi:hypothetical protein
MCNVGRPEAVMCCPSFAMLACVKRLKASCAGVGTHCNEIGLLGLK